MDKIKFLLTVLCMIEESVGRHFSLNDSLVFVGSSDCVIDTLSDACLKDGLLKAKGSTCALNSECFGTGVCILKKCDCPPEYIYQQNICYPAPTFKQSCMNRVCAAPYVCASNNICSCPTTMTETYYGCDLECNINEVLVGSLCLKKAKLGEACSSSVQCSVAFSTCLSSKCVCIQGSAQDKTKTICIPTYRCDNGLEVLKAADGTVLTCRARYCPSVNGQPSPLQPDTCPTNSHCVFPSHQSAQGFCCPEQPWCPNGSPSFDKNCVDPKSYEQQCPTDTHHCYTGHYGTYCCPLPCPSIQGVPAIVVNGLCYSTQQMGESCEITQQCPENSECNADTKLCSCPVGYIAQYRPDGTKCRKICSREEIVIGTGCYSRVLPNQQCTHSAQCTEGTVCRNGACQCPCDKVLYGGNCINTPKCPLAVGSTVANEPLIQADGLSFIECSPSSLSQVLIRNCPSNAYCAASGALSSGGMCCPLPEPVCDEGRLPPQSNGVAVMCDLVAASNPVACPTGQYCRDYASTILPIGSLPFNTVLRGVCCPGSASNIRERPVDTLFPQGGSDSSYCPVNHKVSVNVDGSARFCNFNLYQGECGEQVFCFKVSPSLNLQYSGICCQPSVISSVIGRI